MERRKKTTNKEMIFCSQMIIKIKQAKEVSGEIDGKWIGMGMGMEGHYCMPQPVARVASRPKQKERKRKSEAK